MPHAVDVLVPGRPTLDLVFSRLDAWPVPGREVYGDGVELCAGAHFNTAAALARLGVAVAFVAVVGDDRAGELVMADVRSERVDDRWVRVAGDVPTPVSVALNDGEDRGFVTYGSGHARAEELFVTDAAALLRSVRLRHLHVDLSAARRLLPVAKEVGASASVDAHDAGSWLSSSEVREVVAAADLTFVNESEASGMTGLDGDAADRELGRRSAHVVVKRGARGATAVVGGRRVESPAVRATVVDATGAGDCFAAGYLWAWLRGEPAQTCLRYGNLCGAAAVASPGGYRGAPTAEQLLTAAARSGARRT